MIKMSCPRTDSFTSTWVSKDGILRNEWLENAGWAPHIYLCSAPDKPLTCPTPPPSACRKKRKSPVNLRSKDADLQRRQRYPDPASLQEWTATCTVAASLIPWKTGELHCSNWKNNKANTLKKSDPRLDSGPAQASVWSALPFVFCLLVCFFYLELNRVTLKWPAGLTGWSSGPARCRRCWSCRRKRGSPCSKRSCSCNRKTTWESWTPERCDLQNAPKACSLSLSFHQKAAKQNLGFITLSQRMEMELCSLSQCETLRHFCHCRLKNSLLL